MPTRRRWGRNIAHVAIFAVRGDASAFLTVVCERAVVTSYLEIANPTTHRVNSTVSFLCSGAHFTNRPTPTLHHEASVLRHLHVNFACGRSCMSCIKRQQHVTLRHIRCQETIAPFHTINKRAFHFKFVHPHIMALCATTRGSLLCCIHPLGRQGITQRHNKTYN